MAASSLKYKSKLGNLTAPAEIDLGGIIPLMATTLSTATASVTFSDIPQGYEHLQIRYLARSARTSDNGATMLTQFNSDTGNNYAYHIIYGEGSAAAAYQGNTTNVMRSYSVCSSSSSNTDIYGVGVIDILDYAIPTNIKH